MPIIDHSLIPSKFFHLLKLRQKTSIQVEIVVRNLNCVVQKPVKNIEEIEAMYSHISDHSQEAVKYINEQLGNGFGFVFDGVSEFHSRDRVILNAEISGLEPFYVTIHESNKFVKKFKQVYTEVFGVRKSLDLECLIDLLRLLNEDKNNQKMTTLNKWSLIGSIFSVIDKSDEFLNQLANSPELQTRLMIPISSNSKDRLEFESVDKCVYLVETDDDPAADFQDEFELKVKDCAEKGKFVSSIIRFRSRTISLIQRPENNRPKSECKIG